MGRRKGALEDYRRMRDALADYAPGVHYSLCGWSSWYAPAVSGEEGYHSWRISADCDEFANIYEAARTMEGLADYAGPAKGYNDPDMLVGTSTGAVTLTPTQSRTQFDLWCVFAAFVAFDRRGDGVLLDAIDARRCALAAPLL